jgi:hypothetical protein
VAREQFGSAVSRNFDCGLSRGTDKELKGFLPSSTQRTRCESGAIYSYSAETGPILLLLCTTSA